jgi:hypothetical protein
MVGLAGYALAGAAVGAGDAMVEEARRDFEAMRDELRHARQVERDEAQRTFQGEQNELNRQATRDNADATRALQREMQSERLGHASDEADKSRTFRSEEAEKDRTHRSDEGDKNRTTTTESQPVDRFVGEDGFYYTQPRGGGRAQVVLDKSGKPLRAPTKPPAAKDHSANIARALKDATTEDRAGIKTVDYERYAERLRAYQVPMTAALAAEIERGLRAQLEEAVNAEAEAGDAASWTSDGAYGAGDTREQRVAAEVDRRMAEARRRLGLPGETVVKPAKDAAPVAPRDPSERKVGQVYSNGAGVTAEWTGSGWRQVN